MNWKNGLAALVVFATAGLLIYYSRPIAETIVESFGGLKSSEDSPSPPIAMATAVEGNVLRRSPQDSNFQPIRSATQLHHFDQIKTEREGLLNLEFASGWQLSILPSSLITLEYFHPTTIESGVLVSFTRGEYKVVKVGTTGALFVMMNDKIFSPDTKPTGTQRSVMLGSNEAEVQLNSRDQIQNEATATPGRESEASSLPTARKPGPLPDKLPSTDGETLSTLYISSVIETQSDSLRRCQQNSVRDNTPAEGSILLSITIAPNGRIEKVRLLQDNVRNSRLTGCVISVFERLQFRTFDGLPITMTYPVEFK